MKRISINAALLLVIIPLLLISLLATLWLLQSTSQQSLNDIAEETMSRNINWTQKYIDTLIAPAEDIGNFLPGRITRDTATGIEHTALLESMLERIRYAPHLYSLYAGWSDGSFLLVGRRPYLMQPDGEPRYYIKTISYQNGSRYAEEIWIDPDDPENREVRSLPDDQYDPRRRPWYQQVVEERLADWTSPYIFFMTQKAGITYATPVVGVNGKIRSITGVDLRLEALASFLAENRFSENSVSFIITTKGTVLSHPQLLDRLKLNEIPSLETINDQVLLKGLSKFQLTEAYENGRTYFTVIDTDGGPRDIIFKKVSGSSGGELIIGEHVPESDYLAEMRAANQKALLGAALVLTLALVIGALMSRRMARPIRDLSQMANRVRELDFSAGIKRASYLEEIHQTIDSFNSMIASLEVERQRNQHLTDELSIIIDAMPSILVAVNCEGQVQRWNRYAAESTGITQERALGAFVVELLPYLEEFIDEITELTCRHGQTYQGRTVLPKDGQECHLGIAAYPLGEGGSGPLKSIVIRVDDITKQIRMEEMMVQTEKMLSIGGLAAGMAHEINNPLSIVSQGAENASRRLSADLPANRKKAEELGLDMAKLQDYLEQRGVPGFLENIRHAVQRTSEIIHNMLSFSSSSASVREICPIADVVHDALRLANNDYDLKRKLAFRDVDVKLDLPDDLPNLSINKTEIQQVLFNLLKNAAQAMYDLLGESYQPRIEISARAAADTLILKVSDNGPGIPTVVRNRIFEPFFTTKPVGVGTGLGLSVSYFIVTKRHNGQFLVETAEGEGTTFSLVLPLEGRGG